MAYEPFMLNTTSDHRGIVIDFDRHSLFGKKELIVSPERRGLNASNPIQVDKFIQETSQNKSPTQPKTDIVKLQFVRQLTKLIGTSPKLCFGQKERYASLTNHHGLQPSNRPV